MFGIKKKISVEIAREKCRFNEGCRDCLSYCPSSVFYVGADEPRTLEKSPPFCIIPAAEVFCTGCRECESFCPGKAIRIR